MAKKYSRLSQILKKMLFEREMRASDLAREIDMPVPTIHRIVTGKSTRPYPGSLQAIAKYMNVSVEELTGDAPLNSNMQDIGQFPISKHAKIIPVINCSDIDAHLNGKKVSNITELVVMNVSDKSFAIIMQDYSMIPLFQKGSTLIFDPELSVEDGSYALVKLHATSSYVFRQLLIDMDKQFIKSLNQDTNITRTLLTEDKIIARLVETRNKL